MDSSIQVQKHAIFTAILIPNNANAKIDYIILLSYLLLALWKHLGILRKINQVDNTSPQDLPTGHRYYRGKQLICILLQRIKITLEYLEST